MEEVEKMSNQLESVKSEGDDFGRIRVKRKTLEAVLDQCQKALELLSVTDFIDDEESGDEGSDNTAGSSSPNRGDKETDEICTLLKSRLDCPEFLEKLETAQASVPPDIVEEGSSWDVVNEKDLWDGEAFKLDQDDYVVVRQEDIVDGIACFMAACLLSLKDTKDLTPNQLQEALSKTFSAKRKKGKFRKAWDGSKVIYNVASWGATAIGIYQNPAILKAASSAFWTSCHVISKLF